MEQYFLKEVRKTDIYSSKMANSRKIRKFSNHWLDNDTKTVLVYMYMLVIMILKWSENFEITVITSIFFCNSYLIQDGNHPRSATRLWFNKFKQHLISILLLLE